MLDPDRVTVEHRMLLGGKVGIMHGKYVYNLGEEAATNYRAKLDNESLRDSVVATGPVRLASSFHRELCYKLRSSQASTTHAGGGRRECGNQRHVILFPMKQLHPPFRLSFAMSPTAIHLKFVIRTLVGLGVGSFDTDHFYLGPSREQGLIAMYRDFAVDSVDLLQALLICRIALTTPWKQAVGLFGRLSLPTAIKKSRLISLGVSRSAPSPDLLVVALLRQPLERAVRDQIDMTISM
ncbi:hypothetical protein FHL15_004362 [Xylaria flabelliformis]|uniref:Uncharacterized protein n=1 Tax=Xylaria flabelliformis TaxID=2512241 RepID=A0A553I3Y4_9PEZI|nr:hypothetical protein FHL15_004362 [Xylaria flabelliformis]